MPCWDVKLKIICISYKTVPQIKVKYNKKIYFLIKITGNDPDWTCFTYSAVSLTAIQNFSVTDVPLPFSDVITRSPP